MILAIPGESFAILLSKKKFNFNVKVYVNILKCLHMKEIIYVKYVIVFRNFLMHLACFYSLRTQYPIGDSGIYRKYSQLCVEEYVLLCIIVTIAYQPVKNAAQTPLKRKSPLLP